MSISVVIPCFNEEKYIPGCLNSILNQTVKPEKIIVVDNNSTDQTVKIAKQSKSVIVIQETKQGIVYARNTGFNACHSEIIARCDADSLPPPQWLSKIITLFSKKQVDAVTGPVIFYDMAIKSSKIARLYQKIIHVYQGYPTLIGPNMAISKKIWEKVKNSVCYDESVIHEDIDLAIHIKQKGGKIIFSKSLLSYTSGRRIVKNPLSFFGEYPLRIMRTYQHHNKSQI